MWWYFLIFFQQWFKFTFSIYLKCNSVDGWCCFYERLLRLLWKQLRTLRLRKTFLHRVGAAKYEGMLAVCIFARLENFGISIWNCKRHLSYTKSAGNLKEVDQIVPENTRFHFVRWHNLVFSSQLPSSFLQISGIQIQPTIFGLYLSDTILSGIGITSISSNI